MRIAIDANVLEAPWGGIPKYLDRIGRELVEAGDDVRLLANTRHLERPIPGATEVGVRIKGTPIWREAFLPLWLARAGADVLWAPESVLPRRSPVPTVATVHDLASLRLESVKPARHEQRFRTSVARSVRRATRTIAVSRATAADVEEHYGVDDSRLRIVPNGVDDAFTPGDRGAARAAVRERWGVGSPFVLHVGSLEPRKGLDVLIEAAALAAAEGAGWRLVLAGSAGFEGERIEAAAGASGACELLGRVDEAELLELMRAAGAFAAPALYEGFGIAPLEAMACGTPVAIAAASGGLEEVSGPASIVVGERSPAAWRVALEEALARPSELIERGLRHAARFRWPQVAAETRAVLAEAAATRHPH
ncbi:MAG TPA: glycosyltransferase family 1 protein [Solirubrobacterales bacterium]|jgi:glycosyltransferase involved in cell wall biosynthesis|nr:glycosyltransferase family 1 protein [Solirubrobacterales bacterium]